MARPIDPRNRLLKKLAICARAGAPSDAEALVVVDFVHQAR